tara:strand:- start:1093 stop:1530 length:438 start_codon:yes stop_codon:yes gene_type:complete
MTFEEVYNYLCKERDNLNFESREDFNTEYGISKFESLKDDNIPENIKRFAEDKFQVEEFEYDFMQIQKYELGQYILPHKDNYGYFRLMNLSESLIDGIVIQDSVNKTYNFYNDKYGNIHKIEPGEYHWVNPITDKIRFTVVIGRH